MTTTLSQYLRAGAVAGLGCSSLLACAALEETIGRNASDRAVPQAQTLRLEERTVERPDAFSLTDKALWDGRPSIGPSNWIAVSGSPKPEQVKLVNLTNNKTTVAALFGKGASIPGPEILVSDGVAAKLGIQPGVPVKMSVVALRTEPVPVAVPAAEPAKAVETAEKADKKEDAAKPVRTAALAATATAETAATAAAASAAATAAKSTPAPIPPAKKQAKIEPVAAPESLESTVLAAIETADKNKPAAKAPDRPYVQVASGISKANANKMVAQLAKLGVPGTIRPAGSRYSTVVAGPAQSTEAWQEILRKVRLLGYKDAYAVK